METNDRGDRLQPVKPSRSGGIRAKAVPRVRLEQVVATATMERTPAFRAEIESKPTLRRTTARNGAGLWRMSSRFPQAAPVERGRAEGRSERLSSANEHLQDEIRQDRGSGEFVGQSPLLLELLRVLQEGEFERVGGGTPIHTDARIVAATNRDLQADVTAGRFRPDLYYRLSVFPLRLPALRERPEDLPLLVQHFLAQFQRKLKKALRTLAPESFHLVAQYAWPGNIRELQNVLERACVLAQGDVVHVVDLLQNRPVALTTWTSDVPTLEDVEREHILRVLGLTHGVIQGPHGAARILGLHPNTLRSRMERLGILRARASGG